MPKSNAAARVVVLVDGENFAAARADVLLARVEKLGSIVEVRVYGHFTGSALKDWEESILKHGFTKVDVAITGSNSADFKIFIEAMEILLGRRPDAMCLASADRGFTTLAERIRASAVRAYGISDRETDEGYRLHFDEFIDLSARKAAKAKRLQPNTGPTGSPVPPKPKSARKPTTPPAKQETAKEKTRQAPLKKEPTKKRVTPPATAPNALTVDMIERAIDNVKRDPEGWARLQQVGNYLRKNHPSLPKQIHLWQNVQQMRQLQTETRDRGHFVRRKPG